MVIGAAFCGWMLYEKGKEKGREEEARKRRLPGTASVAQVIEIQSLMQEIDWPVWEDEEDEEYAEWSWAEAEMRLMRMRGKKREAEGYKENIAKGGRRSLPTEFRLGITWNDSAGEWERMNRGYRRKRGGAKEPAEPTATETQPGEAQQTR